MARLLALPPVVTCPHCALPGAPTCCVCHQKRTVTVQLALNYARNIWARPRCQCGTCLQIGPGPSVDRPQPIVSEEPPEKQVGPFDTFKDSFTHRP
jgi:hypothetical protein